MGRTVVWRVKGPGWWCNGQLSECIKRLTLTFLSLLGEMGMMTIPGSQDDGNDWMRSIWELCTLSSPTGDPTQPDLRLIAPATEVGTQAKKSVQRTRRRTPLPQGWKRNRKDGPQVLEGTRNRWLLECRIKVRKEKQSSEVSSLALNLPVAETGKSGG